MKGRSRPTTGYVEPLRPHTIMRLLGKDYVDASALPALEQLISDLESGTHLAAGQAEVGF